MPGPVLTTDTTRREHTCPPDLGADRDAILTELGVDMDTIAAWQAAGAFG